MAERSFKKEVQTLRLGAGAVFEGEGILAVTKALLESGVAYVGGYQGAPISHLMDVFSDAGELMREMGVRFETNASEAGAAAMLGASINYPVRGAVAWKSVVGTNVASDALSNIASAGVTGGALVIVGEDYGEGSSIIQERTHAFAMKSQMWLLDPRPNLTSIVAAVENGFTLSEATNTPVMLQLRIRACHVTGKFIAKDNKRPAMTVTEAANQPVRLRDRIILPPALFAHERDKTERRWPAALKFIRDNGLNEHFGDETADIGVIVQGGLFNSLNRALEMAGLSDCYGNSQIHVLCLNVTYPVVPDEIGDFCRGKRAVLLVEEGQPEFIEHEIHSILQKEGIQTRLFGKGTLPRAGEYTTQVIATGLRAFLDACNSQLASDTPLAPSIDDALAAVIPQRPAGFCTGCPERPIFTAMKLLERDIGPTHVSADIGCHLFSTLPPFGIGNTTVGYGLGAASASAFGQEGSRTMAVMGDGGFWHNGLTSGVGNAVFNNDDVVILVVDNGYAAATGGQDNLSSAPGAPDRTMGKSIETASRGVGVEWIKTVTRTYDVSKMRKTLREAMATPQAGPKMIVAQSECMLNKQRREKPLAQAAIRAGKRVVRDRFGVDSDTCTGDHACIRISGCPSLTIKPNPDPLRQHPVAHVNNDCVGCGLCGEASHAAVLCPSFYRARLVSNPTRWEKARSTVRRAVIAAVQRRVDAGLKRRAF